MPENKIPFMHNNKCLMFALQKWLDFVNISSSDLCCCCFSGLFFLGEIHFETISHCVFRRVIVLLHSYYEIMYFAFLLNEAYSWIFSWRHFDRLKVRFLLVGFSQRCMKTQRWFFWVLIVSLVLKRTLCFKFNKTQTFYSRRYHRLNTRLRVLMK